MRSFKFVAMRAAGAVMAGFLASHSVASAAEPDAAAVLARVNGVEIRLGHAVDAYRNLQKTEPEITHLDDVEALEAVVDSLVNETLFALKGGAKLGASGDYVAENRLRSKAAEQALAQEISAATSEKAVAAAYQARIDTFEMVRQYDLSRIVVGSKDEAAAAKAAVEAGAPFEAVAAERSREASARSNGGRIGWMELGHGLSPAFKNAVLSLGVERVSDPFPHKGGWAILKLNAQRDSEPPTLEQLRDSIVADLTTQASPGMREGLRKAADIKLFLDAAPAEAISDLSLIAR